MSAQVYIVVFVLSIYGYADAQLIQRPTFSYTFNPPFSWTFNQNLTGMWPQQQISAADANRTTFNDVNAAMLTAYQRSGYGLFIGSTKWLISGYVPTNNVTINMARKHRLNEVISEFQQNVALTYVPEVGAVTGFRQTTSQITPYVQSQQIRVTQGTLLLPVSQWQLVASQLQSILNFQYKVNFVTQVTVN